MIALKTLRLLDDVQVREGSSDTFVSATTNSREISPGSLFVAIRGARDGHDFVEAALAAGATGVLVSQPVSISDDVTVATVPDTSSALQQLAAQHRETMGADLVAITGSVGKTTAKNLLAQVFAASAAGEVLASQKSYNNHLGVPLTLLGLGPEHTEGIVEIGTNHPGEIAALTALARPRVALVTGVGHAHIGNFGSRQDLAREKASIFAGVDPDGVWVLNADDEHLDAAVAELARPEGTSVLTYGFAEDADYRVEDVTLTDSTTQGRLVVRGEAAYDFSIGLVGRHFAQLVAAAVAVADERGFDLDDTLAAIASFTAGEGRGQISWARDGRVRVVDDSYNGSPDSMVAALDTLASFEDTRHVAVLGEMRELGEWSLPLHELVGTTAAGSVEDLIFIGTTADVVFAAAERAGLDPARMHRARSATEAYAVLDALLAEQSGPVTVLVKGARFVHTERVALALAGVDVRCELPLCELYIHCRACPQLTTGQAPTG